MVGLWQARTGLPIVLVNIHLTLAVCLVAAMTAVVMHLKEPAELARARGGACRRSCRALTGNP